MPDTITVAVGGHTIKYPLDVPAFAAHRAEGGLVLALHTARRQARGFFQKDREEKWKDVTFWVVLDDSGLAYRVRINRYGTHHIEAAAPMDGSAGSDRTYLA